MLPTSHFLLLYNCYAIIQYEYNMFLKAARLESVGKAKRSDLVLTIYIMIFIFIILCIHFIYHHLSWYFLSTNHLITILQFPISNRCYATLLTASAAEEC